jgi:hypothetical protein
MHAAVNIISLHLPLEIADNFDVICWLFKLRIYIFLEYRKCCVMSFFVIICQAAFELMICFDRLRTWQYIGI